MGKRERRWSYALRKGLIVLLLGAAAGMAFGAGGSEKTAPAGQITLTYWVGINANVAASAKDCNDVPFYQELEKVTGVKVDYIHPPIEQEGDQLNLMIASGDLTDIIESDWVQYTGGPLKAIADGVIVDHTELIGKNAPNLTKYLRANPSVDKTVKTDTGKYYTFPLIRDASDKLQLVYYGMMLRQDWLKELGLPVPETIDEWYKTLTAFKTQKSAPYPLSFVDGVDAFWSDMFVSAYKIRWDFYLDGNKVLYGPIQPGAKQFLATFAQWFGEDLLDKDFAAQDGDTFDAKVTGGQTGAWPGYAGYNISRYLGLMAKRDPKFDIVGATYPVLTKGERPFSGQRDDPYPGTECASITPKCKYPAEAAKWLDYGYGAEGALLNNFGVQGVSYTMVNGTPTLTDLVMHNPDGLSVGQALAKWARSSYGGAFVGASVPQFLAAYPQQLVARQRWSETDADKHRLPPITLSPEEGTRFASIMTQIDTFRDEWVLKFIMNQKPLTEFDAYVAEIKKMGIDEAIAMQQAALDRFNRR